MNLNAIKKRQFFAVCLLFLYITGCISSKSKTEDISEEMGAYLMVYFKDNDHSLHMAISYDGYSFEDVNGGEAIIKGDTIAYQKGIRDPHILRGPDGSFYLAMTDLHIFASKAGYRETQWDRDGDSYGWGNNFGFVLMKSDDLINWKKANVLIPEQFPGYEEIGCAWAPQTIYDEERGELMIYFTMRFGNGHNRLYYSYVNNDYDRLLTEPALLFEYPEERSYIDGDITKVDDKYFLFYVAHDEGRAGIKKAVSDSIHTGYQYDPKWYDFESVVCEAPNVWKRIGEDSWVLMYDVYGVNPHNFGFCETKDFETFEYLGHFNEGVMKSLNFTSPKHGAVIQVTKKEADRLKEHWKE